MRIYNNDTKNKSNKFSFKSLQVKESKSIVEFMVKIVRRVAKKKLCSDIRH